MCSFLACFCTDTSTLDIGDVQSYDTYSLLVNTAMMYDGDYTDEADLIKY